MKIYLLLEQCCLNVFFWGGGFRGHCASLTVWAEVAFFGCLLMDSLSFFSRVFLVCLSLLCLVSFLILSPCSSIGSLLLCVSCWYYLSPHCLPSYESISIELCVSVCWQSLRFGVTAVMLPKGSVLFLLFLLFPTIIWPFQCVRTGSAIYLFIFHPVSLVIN